MFNGIVETIGTVHSIQTIKECMILKIIPEKKWNGVMVGESIAVNGVCLTVTQLTTDGFFFTVVPETLRLTNLAFLQLHTQVNLERALQLGERISGHQVEGHVQGLAIIEDIQEEGDAWLMKLTAPPQLTKYILSKGYVCLDGMSITVIEQNAQLFTVTLIPHTRQVTIAHQYQIGSRLNLETDVFLRFIYKQYEDKQHVFVS